MNRGERNESEPAGMIAGLAGLAKNLFGLLANRVELAALELGEIRANLIRLLVVGAMGIVALWFALACWTALIVVLAWDAMGWTILLLVAGAYTLLMLALLVYARSLLAQDKLSMRDTMNELRKDRDALL